MALEAEVIIPTAPGATGNQTYNTTGALTQQPKAVIAFWAPLAATGSLGSVTNGIGFGTYRGSVVQQQYVAMRSLSGAASMDTMKGSDSNALIKLMDASLAAVDAEVDLVSLNGGGTPGITVNWVNLPFTASTRLGLLLLGGSDITDALAGNFTMGTGSTTQDVTVAAGFGQPNLFFLISAGASGDQAVDAKIMFGWARKGTGGRVQSFTQLDGNTASLDSMRQRGDRVLSLHTSLAAGGVTDDALAQAENPPTNWPTDGFRLVYDAAPSLASQVIRFLALKGTFQSADGQGTVPAATGNVDAAVGFAGKAGILVNWNLVAGTAIDTAGAALAAGGWGMSDGTNQYWAGFSEDDAALTASNASQMSTTQMIRTYSQAAALLASATHSWSGNNFRLNWNDADATARSHQWLAIGDAPAAVAGRPKQARRIRLATRPAQNVQYTR